MSPTRLPTGLPIPALILAAGLALTGARADERAGYYYPPITSEEVFARDLLTADPKPDRGVRLDFVAQLTDRALDGPSAPRFAVFAKGGRAQHLIVVALDDEVFASLYRARAVMARMTAEARGTDFFVSKGIAHLATWFDLLEVLGFEDLVLSNGTDWAHRVVFE